MNTYKNHRAEPYFTFLKNGQKTIEGRVRKGKYAQIKVGDYIEVYNNEETSRVNVRVKRVTAYPSILEMLENEELKKLLPDIDTIYKGVKLYGKFYSPQQELEFGMVAIEIELI
ncbi:MAG: ASCH domain-containing protein [Candidatus Saccharibacteria bacterium]|nr:ASCH domain-containing protein [Candidatus Saccharibacteria bacterium]